MKGSIFHPKALEAHIGILGKTGSGKSFLVQQEVERLARAGERVCLIDPTDRYWGLRLEPSGNKASDIPIVIFGGDRGDIPLAASHGKTVAEVVGTTDTPTIISTRHFTVGERTRFWIDFAETLLRINRGPLHLAIDEAHLFAPQGKVLSVNAGEMVAATNNLVSLGRGAGLRIMLVSQRPAKLHKDSLTQVETLVAMRMLAPQDRQAVKDWMGENADIAAGEKLLPSLPSLPTGTGWVWSPEIGVFGLKQVPMITTFDSGKPAAAAKAKNLKPIDLESLRGKMEKVVEQAKANDPAALKRKIADLESQLAKVKAPAVDPEAAEKARWDGYAQGRAHALVSMPATIERLKKLGADLLAVADDMAKVVGAEAIVPTFMTKKSTPIKSVQRSDSIPRSPRETPPPVRHREAPALAQGDITASDKKILDALAWWMALGITVPTKIQVALIAGYRPGSGRVGNLLGGLHQRGYISYPRAGEVMLTELGLNAATHPGDLKGTVDIHDRVMAVLDPSERKMLQPILDAYPEARPKSDIAQYAGYLPGSGRVGNLFGALRSLGLIDYPSPGTVKAESILFAD